MTQGGAEDATDFYVRPWLPTELPPARPDPCPESETLSDYLGRRSN
jgi:hypothetical protein